MRIAVFVDGSNFFYMQRDCLGWWIDPRKLLDWIEEEYGEDCEISDATYYTTVDPNNESQKSFLKALTYMGYSVVEKTLRSYNNNNNNNNSEEARYNNKKQSNMCVDIITDMFNTIESYDMVVLVSGDADFLKPLESLRARGKKFLVMSATGFISREVRSLAGMHFMDFNEIRKNISKDESFSEEEEKIAY